MKQTKKLICLVLAASMLVTALGVGIAFLAIQNDLDQGTVDDPAGDADASAGDVVRPMEYLSSTSFFEEEYADVDLENGEYINKDYESFPMSQNTTNFQSHGTATFANINGTTVMADAFYRKYNETLNDPNVGLGLLLYQCIQYKIKHPEADVEVCFTSYRTSPTIAVCVVPQSRYYGYMRSLYGNGNDYDENGFVRIVFMLVEAARMGIDVTVVGQLNSYAVRQYTETGALNKRAEPSFVEYFNSGLEYDCYEKYAPGKKVSDFMTFRKVEWTLADKGGTDMMHVKSLTASHYLSTDGVEYENALFLTSSNLDAIDYKGCNGNNGSQSGVLVTGHEKMYNCAVNYIKLMAEYYEQEKLYEMRNLIHTRNTEQAALILAGRADEIPEDEQLIYLGSETDSVFKLYFTPLARGADSWDTEINPYCEQGQNLYESAMKTPKEPIIYTFNCASYTRTFSVSQTLSDMVNIAFNTTKNPKSRLSIQAKNYDYSELQGLVSGVDVGYKILVNKNTGMHSKDMLFSYVKDGVRTYASLLSSCNFHSGALYYQTNSIMTITETEETGGVFFYALGKASTAGGIVDDGMSFKETERYHLTNELSTLPQTFEAVFSIKRAQPNAKGSYGKLFSNYDGWNPYLSYEIDGDGHPKVSVQAEAGAPNNYTYEFVFDQVDVRDMGEVHLAIVHDRELAEMRCYIDGVLMQTVKQEDVKPGSEPLGDIDTTQKFVVGGDWMGSNSNYFTGIIRKLAAWGYVKTDAEIAESGSSMKISSKDSGLLVGYDFNPDSNKKTTDISSKKNNLVKEVLWRDVTKVKIPSDFAYSFAIIGDMQQSSEDYFNDHYSSDVTNGDPYDDIYVDEDTNPMDNKPEYIAMLYDWIIENKEKHKIEYVMGLGNVTKNSYAAEWDHAKAQIYRLSGIVPFSIARGNRDKLETQIRREENGNWVWPDELGSSSLFNRTFDNETYRAEIDGCFEEGDVANTYNAFEIAGHKYLLICLDYGPSDAQLEWAGKLCEQFADHQVIITTNSYLFRDGTLLDENDAYPASKNQGGVNNGDGIWDKLVRKYANIILVLSAHDPWDHIVCTQTEGDNGNVVTQLLINPQNMDAGLEDSTGMIAMLYFSEDGKTVTVRYYSVTRNQYGSDKSQFTFTIE